MDLSIFKIKQTVVAFSIIFMVFLTHKVSAQEYNALEITETVVDFNNKQKLSGVSVVILEKRDDGTWEEYARAPTDKKGYVSSQLFLQKEYLIVFTKKGYIKKKVLIDTRMDGSDEDFYEHDNVLFLTNRVVSDQDSASLLDKPVVRVYYSKQAKGFVFDSLYTATIRKEINSLPPDLTERLIKRIEINAQSNEVDPAAVAQAEKEYQDLLTKIDDEKRKLEEQLLAAELARKKAVQDSIDAANARIKFIADSTEFAQKRAKEIADSLALLASAKKPKPKPRDTTTIAYKPPVIKPIISKTTTPTISTVEVEEAPLTLNKVIMLDAKMKDEIFNDKSNLSTETNVARAYKLAIEKEKMDNMHIKYQTGSPFISLLDEIDMFEKSQKNKANKP